MHSVQERRRSFIYLGSIVPFLSGSHHEACGHVEWRRASAISVHFRTCHLGVNFFDLICSTHHTVIFKSFTPPTSPNSSNTQPLFV